MKVLDAHALLQLPLNGWHLIEANAGTGKTFTLANLYLRLVLGGHAVDGILVVTFTRAATAELNDRLQQRLEQALHWLRSRDESDESLQALMTNALAETDENTIRQRLHTALNQMDQAPITTIHGFCWQALQLHALESGENLQLELQEDNTFRLQAVQDWIRIHGMQTPLPDPLLWQFARMHQFNQPEKLARALTPLLQPASPEIVPWPTEDAATLLAEIEALQPEWESQHAAIWEQLQQHSGLKRNKGNGLKPEAIQQAWPEIQQWWQAPTLPIPYPVTRLLSQRFLNEQHKQAALNKGDILYLPLAEKMDRILPREQRLHHAWIRDIAAWVLQRERELSRQQQQLSPDDLLRNLDDALQDFETGDVLAAALRQRYPVALIDEFQDTDAAQLRIFQHLYPQRDEQARELVILIGDPKQSIYRFRGSDIHSYLRARNAIAPERQWLLNTNWRSTPAMIDAVNQLFGHSDTAWGIDSLHYAPSQPPEGRLCKARPLLKDGQPMPPIHCWTWPMDRIESNMDRLLAQAVARQIAELLQLSKAGRLTLGEAPLQADDIAVLVRSHRQATLVREALATLGIHASSQDKDNIWHSPEAEDMQRLLLACLEPENRRHLRNLLTCHVLQLNIEQQKTRQNDDAFWGALTQAARQAHELAMQQGFSAAFRHLFRALRPEESLRQHPAANRSLSNLLQLAELLQEEAHQGVSLPGLLKRLQQRKQSGYQAAWEPRMEGQNQLVRILTIHKAKGLQFPVVFAPWLTTASGRDDFGLQWARDGKSCWSMAGVGPEEAEKLAEREALAEDVRLAYVALTRAESCLWTAWSGMGKRYPWRQQVLTWLLTGTLQAYKPKEDAETGKRLSAAWPSAAMVALPDEIDPIVIQKTTAPTTPTPLQCARFTRVLQRQWRWHSFSSLIRGLPQPANTQISPDTEENTPYSARFPAGPNPGNVLHELLERVDYQQPISPQLPTLLPMACRRYGLIMETLSVDELALWVQQILHTPLGTDEPALIDLPAGQRIHELPFKLACKQINLQALQAQFQLDGLQAQELSGLLTGIIDLIYHWQGRWWIADFKSNRLGPDAASYDQARMQASMAEHHYTLQYHLYALALHRYLRQRLPDYRPEAHFGGVRYLFLRGMQGADHPGSGVLPCPMDAERLRWLDEEAFPWQQ